VATDRIEQLEVLVSNYSTQPQIVKARLLEVEHIWDYRVDPSPPLAEADLTILPGERQWVSWPVAIALVRRGYVRLDVEANPMVAWHACERIVPGHVAAFDMGGGRMRRYGNGVTLGYRISPPQPCFAPENVLTGVTRPHRWTNLWRSDPSQRLPQWLQLTWSEPQTIAQVELTFPGHLVREYHAYSPFYRDPQCPRDYMIECWKDERWVRVLEITGNYQRHRRHALATAVTSTQLRIVITSTNGDPTAAIYEVRCYA
jgi:hypothetical protein